MYMLDSSTDMLCSVRGHENGCVWFSGNRLCPRTRGVLAGRRKTGTGRGLLL